MKKKSTSLYGSNGFLIIIALTVVLVFVGILLAKGVNKKIDELSSHESSTQQASEITPTQQTQILFPTQEIDGTQQTLTSETQETSEIISFPTQQGVPDISASSFSPVKPLYLDGNNWVKFKIDRFQKLATQPLKFEIFDETNRELTPQLLQTHREQKVHFYLVSANLKEYLHLYPVYENGVWNVKAYMPTPGTYYSYISIVPIKGQPMILRNELIVRNPTEGTPDFPSVSANGISFTAGYELKLTAEVLTSKKTNTLSFFLTQNGKEVSVVQPYDGSFGHIMVFYHENPSFDVFPLTPLASTDESKGRFDFTAAIGRPGRYTAFAEFFVGRRLLIFALTFNVEASST